MRLAPDGAVAKRCAAVGGSALESRLCDCGRRSDSLIAQVMADKLQTQIIEIVSRAPEWIRQELASKDQTTRNRAEDALATLIATALNEAAKRASA